MAARVFACILACALFLTDISCACAGYPSLFAAPEEKFSDIGAFYKWTDMLSRFGSQHEIPAIWRYNDRRLRTLPQREMIESVNSIINSYAYISAKSGKILPWATPAEFFARGGGSCRDFAIAKYLWLAHLGLPEDKLRVAIVYDKKRRLPHALSLVYTGRAVMVLDNQDSHVKDSRLVTRYRPIYSINRVAWWRYSGQGVRVDSAGKVTLERDVSHKRLVAGQPVAQVSFLPTVK